MMMMMMTLLYPHHITPKPKLQVKAKAQTDTKHRLPEARFRQGKLAWCDHDVPRPRRNRIPLSEATSSFSPVSMQR